MRRVSLLVSLGVVASMALVPAIGTVAASANTNPGGPVIYHGIPGHVSRLALSTRGLAGLPQVRSRVSAATIARVNALRTPAGPSPAFNSGLAARVRSAAPAAVPYALTTATVDHKFNGISDKAQATVDQFGEVTPPDQGLCAGFFKPIVNQQVIFELVNLALLGTSVNGTALTPLTSLNNVFQDPFAEGDPRCLFDPATKTFFFTEVGFPVGTGPNGSLTNTTVDVTVLNAQTDTVAFYQFDTSLDSAGTSQQCLGDQPKVGFNSNALVISTDQFCGSSLNNFEGALVLAISKPELVAHDQAVGVVAFPPPLALGGIPGLGLDPAINTGTGSGFLVESFPFDANGNANATFNKLGVWELENTASITQGSGPAPELEGTLIKSETYAFPVPAASTGDGTINNNGELSEQFLQPNDSRVNGPVFVTTSNGSLQLWAALDSAVTVNSQVVDGAAWFKISAASPHVLDQNFVAVGGGGSLLYPALAVPRFSSSGTAQMVFTITSPSINPSAAYTTLTSGLAHIVAMGQGPHLSFAFPSFGRERWGDYSFSAIDTNGNSLWFATEYIPPIADQGVTDNWGTFVFRVSHS